MGERNLKHNSIKQLLCSNKKNNIKIDDNLKKYFNLLCPNADEKTFFSVFDGKTGQRWSVGLDDLEYLNVEGQEDLFCSVNTFYFRGGHKQKYVRHINAIILDIDYYKIEHLKGLSPEQVIWLMEEDLNYPPPSMYKSSGRGITVFWLLENTFATTKTKRFYRSVVRRLHEIFSEFGVDKKVRDLNRVTRLDNTKNSKSNTFVKTLYKTNKRYELIELTELIFAVKLNRADKENNNNDTDNKCNLTTFKSPLMIHYLRYKDLETLVELREGQALKGMREVLLFIYRLQFLLSKTSINDDIIKESLELTLELNKNIHDSLSKKEVISRTKSAVTNAQLHFKLKNEYEKNPTIAPTLLNYLTKNGVYLYKNQTIIENLDIQQEEMLHLKMLIDVAQKKKRKYNRNKLYYKEQLSKEGKISKKVKIDKNKDFIIKAQNTGKTNKQIYKQLGISRATFYRYLKEIKRGDLL